MKNEQAEEMNVKEQNFELEGEQKKAESETQENSKMHYDEDRHTLVKRKPLPEKLKRALQCVVFALIVAAVSVVGSFVYFESTQIDLEKYYIVGSYRVVSLEKVYPDLMLTRKSSTISIDAIDGGKRYEQIVIYDFTNVTEKNVDSAMKDYVQELKKKINGFQVTDIKLDAPERQMFLTKQESKHTISLLIEKDAETKTFKIKISYV